MNMEIDITGHRYGRLVVLSKSDMSPNPAWHPPEHDCAGANVAED
jgi:hypothetical protein